MKNKYLEAMKDMNPDALYPTGHEDAIIGIVYLHPKGCLFLISKRKLMNKLMARDHMTDEEALEYCEYNIICAYHGEGTPVFLDDIGGDF